MTINQRNKGQSGERELCLVLSKELGLRELLTRNIDQVRDGGADIMGLPPFAIEVKRQQSLNINAWLKQAVSQVTPKNPIPVLAYRQNNRKWTFMIPFGVVAKKKLRKKVGQEWISMGIGAFIAICSLKYGGSIQR